MTCTCHLGCTIKSIPEGNVGKHCLIQSKIVVRKSSLILGIIFNCLYGVTPLLPEILLQRLHETTPIITREKWFCLFSSSEFFFFIIDYNRHFPYFHAQKYRYFFITKIDDSVAELSKYWIVQISAPWFNPHVIFIKTFFSFIICHG